MSTIKKIVQLWSDANPVAGYTGGHLSELTSLFVETPDNLRAMRARIDKLQLESQANITDADIRATAEAVLTSLRTQLDLARPSGAGPSGTGMSGLWAAADGVFYIVLKQDQKKDFVPTYLEAVRETVQFETARWWGQDFTIEVRRECLDTVAYMQGTLAALVGERPDVADQVQDIKKALVSYSELFAVEGLDSDDFDTYWPIFREWDAVAGPSRSKGYPACLESYYQLTNTATQIEVTAKAWLDLDLPVTLEIAEQVSMLPFVSGMGSLQEIWDQVSAKYQVDASDDYIKTVETACNNYGRAYIIQYDPKTDPVNFTTTPTYLENLVTGGEDFAVDYLDPQNAYSQLYLTKSKNTSLLTMINILVHEASHGFNFVLSAKNAVPALLNLNTALEVPMTEGMAFYREYQYWAAAQSLVGREDLNEVQDAYMKLYGCTPEEQEEAVLCAQLETYIWRVIRYVRALCDVKVCGGEMTYTAFIEWAADYTGLSQETLHGECFTFIASPGYAPCYAIGGVAYSVLQKTGIARGISEKDFNTYASRQGFYAWPVAQDLLHAYVTAKSNV